MLEEELAQASKFARALVAKRVAIIAVVTIILHLAVSYGWITSDWSDATVANVTAVLDAIGAITAILVIQPKVTPVDDPRDNEGTPLVPVDALTKPVELDETNLDTDAGFVKNNVPADDDEDRPKPY